MSPTRRRRTMVAVVIGSVLAVGAGATAFVVTRDDHASAHTSAPAVTTTKPPTTTATTRATTTTLPPLPQPSAPPIDAYADVPVYQIGTITIPKIGLVSPIFEGVWLTVVDHGPGHWPGSALPGHRGNAVFAGHRVTHTHPFYDLDLLAPGERIIFDMADGTFTYAVTSITIVQPNDLAIANPTPKATVTLFACNPKHSAAQRIVVKGRLIKAVRKAVTKPTAAPGQV